MTTPTYPNPAPLHGASRATAAPPPQQPQHPQRPTRQPREQREPSRSGAIVITVLGAIVAIGLLTGATATNTVNMLRYTTSGSEALSAQITSLRVDSDIAEVRISTATEGAEPSVDWTATGVTGQSDTSVRMDGTEAVVTTRCGRNLAGFFSDRCETTVNITIPEGTAVQVDNSVGATELVGLSGPVDVTSAVGSIEGDELSGPITATTSVGAIELRSSDSTEVTMNVNTGSGELISNVPVEHLRGKVGVGSLDVALPADGESYRVVGRSGLGERTIDVPTDPASERVLDLNNSTGNILVRAR